MENMVNDGLGGMEERKVFSLVVGARRAWSDESRVDMGEGRVSRRHGVNRSVVAFYLLT